MTIRWQGYDWLTEERWGSFHPRKPLVWYDPDAVKILSDELHLQARATPGILALAPYGIGLVSCTERFTHGHFEIEAKLPRSPNAWPAFWFWGFETYPPEIDVMEGYANRRGSYFRFGIPWWNVSANVWPPGKPATKPFFWNPAGGFARYSLVWTPESIEIRYNGQRIMRRDVRITQPMNLVINNSLRKAPPEPFMSDFVIRSFVYTK